MNYKTSTLLLQHIRRISTCKSLKNKAKNHYESLEIPKEATQADVKSAYYRLSKIYHPDISKDNEEHSQKFRDISEAYEVLGNVKTRKMYDKGFYMGHIHSHAEPTPADPLHKFYKSRETRTRPPPPSGRTPIYDFDSWAKAHYGETFRRSQDFKHRYERMNRRREEYKNDEKHEMVFLSLFIMIGVCTYISGLVSDYDTVNLPGGGMPVRVKKEIKESTER